jgi:hypothetical protein
VVTIDGRQISKKMEKISKEIIEKAQQVFSQRENVVDVSSGYKFVDGWITDQPAIVVKVSEKKTENKLRAESIELLPREFAGLPVEVIEPTVLDYINEMEIGDIFKVNFAGPITSKYFPPQDLKLSKVTEHIRLIAHVSPEKGWENLKAHLLATEQTNTIAMYDFGATHIRDAVIQAAGKPSFRSLTLAIQKAESLTGDTKKDDLTDEQMISDIKVALKDKFRSTWVKTGINTGWVPYSYHIKVSVSDSKRFWLSSGNWQSSNQPKSAVTDSLLHRELIQKYNREWNLIIENGPLSVLLEKFIFHDYDNNLAKKENKYLELAQEILFDIPIEAFVEPLAPSPEVIPFEPLIIDREVTLTPLLSPDNYFEEVLELIKSAQSELYIQNQTFNSSWNDKAKKFDKDSYLYRLLMVVLDKQEKGVDVKIIFRGDAGDPKGNLTNLVKLGFDAKNIKVQDKCHTKGIMVDGEKVLVGSHNWSNMGVSLNRDASILFDDPEITSYFRTIFLHDWEKIAVQKIRSRVITDQKQNQFMKVSLRQLQEIL